MKRFIFSILSFIIPIAIGLIVIEYGVRRIPNDYSYKNGWLEKNASCVNILALGSSHGFYGIQPQAFTNTTFNAAHVAQSLKYDAFILDKFIEKADSLQLVILPISYSSVLFDLESDPEWWRIKKYCIYYHCPYHKWDLKYRTEIVGLKMLNRIKRSIKYISDDVDDITCDTLGWCKLPPQNLNDNDWNLIGIAASNRHTKEWNPNIVKENKKYIEDIITHCSNNNVKVLLLSTPTYCTYYKNVDEKQLEMMSHCCDSFSIKYENTYYLNLFKDNQFTKEDFRDPDHLNGKGAKKLSILLNDYCNNMILIDD